ncbi:uncharacterized protein WM294_009591 isoform 1-T2 [Sarcoramphus papa]
MQSQAAALREEAGEQGHDLCSRCRLCPGQTSSRCHGRAVRAITTGLDVTTARRAGAAPAPPVHRVVSSPMPAEDWMQRTWQKAENLFLREFLPFFFFQHPSVLVCPTVSCNSSISPLWVCIRTTSSRSAAGSSSLCHPMRESRQKSGLDSYAGLTIAWGHQCGTKQPAWKEQI